MHPRYSRQMIKPAIASAVLVVLALSACSSTPTASPTPTATQSKSFVASGSMTAPINTSYMPPGADGHSMGEECITSDGYDDIAEGGQVIVSDDGGKTVGVGDLSAGVLTAPAGADSIYDATCVFRFRVDVESDSTFFGVKIGNENRGVLQYKRADLLTGVDLVLGD